MEGRVGGRLRVVVVIVVVVVVSGFGLGLVRSDVVAGVVVMGKRNPLGRRRRGRRLRVRW